jgi:hypothetical protein
MSDLNLTTPFILNPDIAYTIVDDETVVLGMEDNMLLGINPVGTELFKQWALKPMSIESINQYLLTQFEVDAQQALQDTKHFVNELLEKQLIIELSM